MSIQTIYKSALGVAAVTALLGSPSLASADAHPSCVELFTRINGTFSVCTGTSCRATVQWVTTFLDREHSVFPQQFGAFVEYQMRYDRSSLSGGELRAFSDQRVGEQRFHVDGRRLSSVFIDTSLIGRDAGQVRFDGGQPFTPTCIANKFLIVTFPFSIEVLSVVLPSLAP